jgi:ElaB/YqjD/DUF883 family membrane-anchored ribosome-binding protein
MIRFLIGIIVIQIATIALVMLAPDNLQGLAWLRLLIPLLVFAMFAAFWFSSIASHKSKDQLSNLEARHAQEREKLQVNAERAKTRIMKKTQQQISKETKIVHGKANFKVGATLAGAVGFGALMLLTEMLTLGIMTITTAGGALGGYLYRGNKEKKKSVLLGSSNAPLIVSKQQPERLKKQK